MKVYGNEGVWEMKVYRERRCMGNKGVWGMKVYGE